jgi:hypothetical protein
VPSIAVKKRRESSEKRKVKFNAEPSKLCQLSRQNFQDVVTLEPDGEMSERYNLWPA